jgi:hypothetical protein
VTIPLQALSLVEKAELVQVRFTLHSRDQQSMWMQDWCKVYMVSYMAPNGSCFMVTWTILQKPPLGGGRPNTKPGDHGTPNAHNCWFILSYHAWGPAWIEIHWHSICLRARLHTTSHYHLRVRDHTSTWFRRLSWNNLWTLFFWALTISWSRLLARVWRGLVQFLACFCNNTRFKMRHAKSALNHVWHIEIQETLCRDGEWWEEYLVHII